MTAPIALTLGSSRGFYATSRRLAFEGLMLLAAVVVPYVLIYPPWNNQWKVPLAYHQDGARGTTITVSSGTSSTTAELSPQGTQIEFPLVLERPTAVVHLTPGSEPVGTPANPELRVKLANLNVVDPLVARTLQPRA